MKKLNVTNLAKIAAKDALNKRKSLPKSKHFGLGIEEARRQGIVSGVGRAKQLIRSDTISCNDAKRVAAFYQRFKNRSSPKVEGSLDLWGGRDFGRKAVKFVKQNCK